jgi:hypothetical protein
MGVTQNFTYADRVKETTETTGTGDYVLGGAVASFQTFDAVLSDSDKLYYAISDGTDFEVGIGILTIGSPDNSISRESILSSSNSGAAVSWGAGEKEIFLTAPANIFDSGLLWEYEVTGAAESSIDTGAILDINTHRSYRIEVEVYNPTGTPANLACLVNGDTTTTNYHIEFFNANSTTLGGGRANINSIGNTPAAASTYITCSLTLSQQGVGRNPRFLAHECRNLGASVLLGSIAMTHNVAQSNITQLTFSPNVASSLGVGTKIRIYRGDR